MAFKGVARKAFDGRWEAVVLDNLDDAVWRDRNYSDKTTALAAAKKEAKVRNAGNKKKMRLV